MKHNVHYGYFPFDYNNLLNISKMRLLLAYFEFFLFYINRFLCQIILEM